MKKFFAIGMFLLMIAGTYAQGTNQVWREELGYGMFAINQGDPNGARSRTIYRLCSACRGTTLCGNCYGTARCTLCNGQGYIITAGYGTYLPCAACGQSGRCMVCGGTGRCVCTQYEYPGYMPGSTIVVGVDGQVISNINYGSGSSGSSSSGSSSRSSSGSSKRSGVGCSQCNYTGVDPSPSGGNLTSWVAYYNSSGNKCPYCGHYDSHQHARCAHCNVPTR